MRIRRTRRPKPPRLQPLPPLNPRHARFSKEPAVLAICPRIPHLHPVIASSKTLSGWRLGAAYLNGFGGLFINKRTHTHVCRTNNDGWSKLDIETFGKMLEARNTR